jgi:hypothetical protein
LDGTFGLDGGDSGVDILGDDITTVHHATSHVIRAEHEMDTWVWYQVSLELSNIDVKSTIESERCSQG